MRPSSPSCAVLPGDLPGAQSPKVPEGRTALWAKSQGGRRPAGPCPPSARPHTHAFLQLCITRSCSPATALQAASSLVHCSWWGASARQGGDGARCQPCRPWWHLGPYCPLRPFPRPGFGRGVHASKPAFLAVGASSGHRPQEWLVPTVTPAPSLSRLNFLCRQERGKRPLSRGWCHLSRVRPGSPRLSRLVPWRARLLPARVAAAAA